MGFLVNLVSQYQFITMVTIVMLVFLGEKSFCYTNRVFSFKEYPPWKQYRSLVLPGIFLPTTAALTLILFISILKSIIDLF